MKRLGAAVVGTMIFLGVLPALAQCVPVPIDLGAVPPSFRSQSDHLRNLQTAFRGIARAADVYPKLWACDTSAINAAAFYDEENGHAVMITAGMLNLLDGNVDEIAAILGHEFGHLLHKHGLKRRDYARQSFHQVVSDAQRRLNRGAQRKAVLDNAERAFVARVTAFSREAEREADDQGFTLSRIAGFDKSGARRAAEKLRDALGGEQRGWFASHPGWNERAGYAARLELNEDFRRAAETLLASRQLDQLAAHVGKWKELMPDSGAASFYLGMHLHLNGAKQQSVSEAFEAAVSNFAGEGLSKAGQSYQSEGYISTVALCVSLFREDRKLNALSCLKKLETKEEIELFKQITGWRNFLLLGNRPEPPGPTLYGGETKVGVATITNCEHIAQREGLRAISSWRGIRPARGQVEAKGDAWVCSPDLCDCRLVDLDAAFPGLSNAAR